MKHFFLITLLGLCMATCHVQSLSAKPNKQQVTFYVHLHCQNCIDKIYKNIAFEKGVKALDCNREKQTVVITYDANKTDIPTLQAAFKAINKPASLTPIASLHDKEEEKGHN